MQTKVSPEQRQAAKREIVRQIEQGIETSVARIQSAVSMHRATVYRLLKQVQSEGERALIDGRHGHPVKFRGEALAFVREHCQTSPYVDGHRKPVYSDVLIPRGLIGRLGVILGCRALVLMR